MDRKTFSTIYVSKNIKKSVLFDSCNRLPNTVDNSLISIELPKTFGTRVRNALDASPTSVDFRLLCPYFYLFGVKLLDLVVDDSLSKVLKEVNYLICLFTVCLNSKKKGV